MRNKEIAEQFYLIAQLLSLTDENQFKIRAYEKVSQVIEALPEPIEEITKDKEKLFSLPGVGKGMAEKVIEYLQTGKIQRLEELKTKFPSGILEILKIPGLGPKRVKLLYEKLGIKDIAQLKEFAKKGLLKDLPGFGEKVEKNILEGIQFKTKSEDRLLLFDAMTAVDEILAEFKNKNIIQIDPCGSLRRKKETVGDIDILCCTQNGKEQDVIKQFTLLGQVEKILAHGETKASIMTKSKLQVDLRVIPKECYGAALQYFTGSKQHNIHLRELANKQKLTISEYGVFKIDNKEKPIAGKEEVGIYNILGLDYIPPELREDRGEIDAALNHKLPKLVEMEDIKGDTHIHSKYSDGANTISEIVDYAEKFGYEWIIICDHSQSLKIAGGLDIKGIYKKIDEIRKINEKSKVKVLCGTEVDILSDGKLDYPDDVLKKFDFVIAAIHTGFKQGEEQITDRILSAMDNKYVHAISHPTGRLLNKRPSYKVNIIKIIEYAAKNKVILEINAFPERLDLDDIHSKYAKEKKVKLSIGTDAHHLSQMGYISQGVYVARRGWLEKNDLINTLSYTELKKFLSSKRNSFL